MKIHINLFYLLLIMFITSQVNGQNNIHDITVNDSEGNPVSLSEYKGKVLLLVNVASKCGYTRQYEDLQKLYEKYKDEGFEILAFPCNDFGGQEPGTLEEIKQFCSLNYGVTFRIFDKVNIKSKPVTELYKVLMSNESTGKDFVKWNFEKFLISKNGEIIKRFRSGVEPLSDGIIEAIESELK